MPVSGGMRTIGLDLGDRFSWYCVLNEAGEVVLEQKVATTPKAMKEVFGGMPRSRMALETGTHSPWVSRILSELGHEVIITSLSPSKRLGVPCLRSAMLEVRRSMKFLGPTGSGTSILCQRGICFTQVTPTECGFVFAWLRGEESDPGERARQPRLAVRGGRRACHGSLIAAG